MSPSDRRRCLPLAGICFLIALLGDQLSKAWLLSWLPDDREVTLLPVFDLVRAWNTGISFSLFAGADQRMALIAMSLVIVAILLAWLWKCDSKLAAAGLGLVIGGALGNVIDRVRFGAVADFFDFHLGAWHFPAFNIADSCIFMGVVLLSWHSMVTPKRQDSVERGV